MPLHMIDFTEREYTKLYNWAYRGAGRVYDKKRIGVNFERAMDRLRAERHRERLSVPPDPCHRERRKMQRHGESVVIEIRK